MATAWKITINGTRRAVTPEERLAETKTDPYKSIWEGGTVVEVAMLPLADLDAIAATVPGQTWWTVMNHPLVPASLMYAVAKSAAKLVGVDPPAEPVTGEDGEAFTDLFERIQPIDEKPFEDGFPPTPDEQEIGSQSGSPGISDGPSTSPDDNPPTIS